MAVGLGRSLGWGWAPARSDGDKWRAAPAIGPGAADLVGAGLAARITPILTDLAPHAPNLCATVTPRGNVILDGCVSERSLASQAAAQMAAIPGMGRVYNHLLTDTQIAALIEAALALDERTTWETIAVSSECGVVTLRGLVTSPAARRAAEEIARRAPLVWRVENMLAVQQPDDDEARVRGAEVPCRPPSAR
ncbi:MAG TPA: BON domain-containing protein [Roseiflexaceae bacterium]|nr:BON domain-containing protein [Roseiflexaceae bacterium]